MTPKGHWAFHRSKLGLNVSQQTLPYQGGTGRNSNPPFCEGTLPNIIKQLIIFTVSAERPCNDCAEAHKLFVPT